MYRLIRHILNSTCVSVKSVLITAAFFFAVFSLSGQINLDIGQLSVRNFTSKNYHASPQNWSITQDTEGLMYFGNTEGILIYDGLSWNNLKSSNESVIRSLDVSPSGMVYVGAVGDFGYLSVDKFGKHAFVSLQRHLASIRMK